MARGIALNIGVNQVDPNQYGGQLPVLKGSVKDAEEMHAIAEMKQYGLRTLLRNEEATAEEVLARVEAAAAQLQSGDIFLLTFSGHGSRMNTGGGEEPDHLDDTWILWDRNLIDNELAARWCCFQPGVRILIVSDSCHSGTILLSFNPSARRRALVTVQRKKVGDELQQQHLQDFAAKYEQVRQDLLNNPCGAHIRASVLLLAASKESEPALDGHPNSLYTTKLLEVWKSGNFGLGYIPFHERLVREVGSAQTPQLEFLGAENRRFVEDELPFSI